FLRVSRVLASGAYRYMDIDEKASWNKKYSEGSHSSLEPDPFLVSACDEFLFGTSPGLALDVAGGVGRHAIWLAQRGWRVKLVDISEVGIKQAEENAKQTGTVSSIITEVRDLNSEQDLGPEQYDLVMVFFFLQRELFPALVAALKPGGILIYKTYTTEQKNFAGGPSHPMFLLQPNELLRAFPSLRVLHYHETIQERGVAELVARK
ncbi:MAG TPA: class I SAM-dependent methyltransferase, partial [Alphaproteobacteria bacterium]|nr:class I SAM-dependent methyltransferase [Alphaproteobacteria bacterium]